MYVKKIKRKCGVRGCRCTESYAISRSREMGNSIIACESCLVEALAEIDMKYARREAEEGEMPIPLEEEAPAEEEAVEEITQPVEAPAEVPKSRQRKK